MSLAVLLVTLAIIAVTNPFWWPASPVLHRLGALVAALLLSGLWVAELFVTDASAEHVVVATDVALLGVAAVLAGGPVTTALLAALEEPDDDAARVLRGGAWIGVLERAAVYLCVVSGHPQAVALVVAVKGLGRYPELQSSSGRGAAERFIAGTLASLLWAGGCAVVAQQLGG